MIIPITAEGFVWPEKMPEGLESIKDYNSIPYVQVYSDQFFEPLYSFVDNVRNKKGSVINAGDKKIEKREADSGKKLFRPFILIAIVVLLILAFAGGIVFSKGRSVQNEMAESIPEREVDMESSEAEDEVVENEPIVEEEIENEPESEIKKDEEEPEEKEKESGETGNSMSNATEIPISAKIKGRYSKERSWISFTTSEDKEAKYVILLQNNSMGKANLRGYLYDASGNEITTQNTNEVIYGKAILNAHPNGIISSAYFEELSPGGSYYIMLESDENTDYSLAVAISGHREEIMTEKTTILGDEDYYTATNQDEAPLIKNNVTYIGEYEGGSAWLAFTTSEDEGSKYTILLQNLSSDSDDIKGYLYDEYGYYVNTSYSNEVLYGNLALKASPDGIPSSSTYESLDAGTTYYIMLEGDKKARYSIVVSD